MKPTAKQLAFLRVLAQRTGETFTYPSSRGQASAEISRLTGRPVTSLAERARERHAVSVDLATRAGDAAAIQTRELVGHGSTATWSGDHAEPTPARRRLPVVGRRAELARYTLADGTERVVYGQRIDGVVRVFDKPADGVAGRSFLIERGLTTLSELNALVTEYVADSTEHDRPAALATGDLADA
jgi:hypothetical protein